jgi:hypothetical protein
MQDPYTHKFDPTAPDPAKALYKQQDPKHHDEAHVKLVAKYGHGQARLGHGVPRLFVQPLNLRSAKRPVKHKLQYMAKQYGDQQQEVRQDLHASQ